MSSHQTYAIEKWSEGYFQINADGAVEACPDLQHGQGSIALPEIVAQLQSHGLKLPVLVRFTDILRHRVQTLCEAFESAQKACDYTGGYTAVYPIKVNQQFHVVETILHHKRAHTGLEAGSKPELLAVLGIAGTTPTTIVCNGYKDDEYISLALIAQRLGHRVLIILEKISEVQRVLRCAAALNITPTLGVRIRLASIGKGKWQNTGGEKSKFGLTATQILSLVDTLKAQDALNSLQCLHFHLGSQLSNLKDIQTGLAEAARFYEQMHTQGVPIQYVDVGGGLAVDYEGRGSRSYYSMNYSLEDYAREVVNTFHRIAVTHRLPMPHLLTESGRAMTAHHAVLITNVIDTDCVQHATAMPQTLPEVLSPFERLHTTLGNRNVQETYHGVLEAVEQLQAQYLKGEISLAVRAQGEQCYTQLLDRIRTHLNPAVVDHRAILDHINETLANKYFCNVSVFQSLPDVWAIDQIFPIVPIHRLNESEVQPVVLQDITCDSDGHIESYVVEAGLSKSLPLPEVTETNPLYLGFFMVGAYQEILGDMHNLFGDTDSVHVTRDKCGALKLFKPLQGNTVFEVLQSVQYDRTHLIESYTAQIEASGLPAAEAAQYLEMLTHGLEGITYFE